MNNLPFSLDDFVGPIIESIGHDFTRLSELNSTALAALLNAQVAANFGLMVQLVELVGDKVAAEELLARALERDPKTAKRYRALLDATLNAGLPPRPTLLAAHVAFGLQMQEMLAIEALRQTSLMN